MLCLAMPSYAKPCLTDAQWGLCPRPHSCPHPRCCPGHHPASDSDTIAIALAIARILALTLALTLVLTLTVALTLALALTPTLSAVNSRAMSDLDVQQVRQKQRQCLGSP